MPTLFDSHDEFNEWFSKDIESHVEKQSMIDEGNQGKFIFCGNLDIFFLNSETYI